MKVLDVFAGCGGSRLGFERAGHQCVGSIEIGKWQRIIYEKNFGKAPEFGDITKTNPADLPPHEVLAAGLPCQPFSFANRSGSRGFSRADAQLLFPILRIVEYHKPKFILFENVEGLLSDSEGRSFATWLFHLEALGYDAEWAYFNGASFGLKCGHQHVFVVGWNREKFNPETELPEWQNYPVHAFKTTAATRQIVQRITTKARAGFDNSTVVLDEYGFRTLIPAEIELILGFPKNWTKGAPESQRHRMLGNVWPPIMAEFLGKHVLPGS